MSRVKARLVFGATAAFVLGASVASGAGAQESDVAASGPISTVEPSPASAATAAAPVEGYKRRIEADEQALVRQEKQIADQRATLDAQQREIDALKAEMSDSLASIRAGSALASAEAVAPTPAAPPSGPSQPVGQAPPAPQAHTVALPPGINVLMHPGHVTYEAGADYQNSASNRLVFEGVEIANALLIGVIQASTTSNNAFIDWNTVYVGVAPRFEIDAAIPYVDRNEMVTTVVQANSQLSQSYALHGSGFGDFEFTGRYQVTAGYPGEPIVIANLRVKSNTGVGPYDVHFDAAGAATELPVGSGFWAVQPSLSILYPSDPVILFANVAYLHSFGYDINKTIGNTNTGVAHIGLVTPGDAISAALGFSFALNQHFSYSIGYRNDYFLPTVTTINRIKGTSLPLEDGAFLLTGSYRLSSHLSINLNFQFGVTPDAPNTTILLRLPYTF